ncbi:MAG: Protein-export rane protein SecF [Ilumatobacteraceae bacterium]|nr:Protein-export rane protein SecF [Ilumatobacteraceae bacterium]
MSTDVPISGSARATAPGGGGPTGLPPRRGAGGRLYHGETSIDFYGRRWWSLGASIVLRRVTLVSLVVSGLNLGIDFKGGVSWEVPAQNFTVDQARTVLAANGVNTNGAKIVELTSTSGKTVSIQAEDQTLEKQQTVRQALAKAAGVDEQAVSSSAVSSTWGSSITKKAVRALLIFLLLVAMFIAWRFEWRMAVGAIAAMVHDVLISVGVYSLLGFEVTPATVVAFLTILGFSLYDTIVVFDKVQDNEARFSANRVPYADVVNVSMNQVLMRSLNTSLAAVLPVLSLLILGAGIMGAVTLREFALALLVGLITGSYSSIFVATPLLTMLKERIPKYRVLRASHATGDELERLVLGAAPTGRDRRQRTRAAARTGPGAGGSSDGGSAGRGSAGRHDEDRDLSIDESATALLPAGPKPVLTHPPRPRKKKRRGT